MSLQLQAWLSLFLYPVVVFCVGQLALVEDSFVVFSTWALYYGSLRFEFQPQSLLSNQVFICNIQGCSVVKSGSRSHFLLTHPQSVRFETCSLGWVIQWQFYKIFIYISIHFLSVWQRGCLPWQKMCYGKRVVCHKPGKELMYHFTEFGCSVTTILMR